MLAWSGTPSNRETSQAAAEMQEGATERDLVGICLRELTWWTAGSEGGGMGIFNSYLPAGAIEGHDPWVTFRRRHYFYAPGRKQACRHDSGLLWCLCHSLLVLASEGREIHASCIICPPHPSLFSYLLIQSSVCHTTLVCKSRSFP